MTINETLKAFNYTIEHYEIHAWKLAIHDSRNIYYSTDYDNITDFDSDIIRHLLQYGIEAVYLISHDKDDNEIYYTIASIFDIEVDAFNDEYFRLRRINKDA
jgi:hypothetical protein